VPTIKGRSPSFDQFRAEGQMPRGGEESSGVIGTSPRPSCLYPRVTTCTTTTVFLQVDRRVVRESMLVSIPYTWRKTVDDVVGKDGFIISCRSELMLWCVRRRRPRPPSPSPHTHTHTRTIDFRCTSEDLAPQQRLTKPHPCHLVELGHRHRMLGGVSIVPASGCVTTAAKARDEIPV